MKKEAYFKMMKRAGEYLNVQFPLLNGVKYYKSDGSQIKSISGKEVYKLARLLQQLSRNNRAMKMNKARLRFDDKGIVDYANASWDPKLQEQADKAVSANWSSEDIKKWLAPYAKNWDLKDPKLLNRDLYIKQILGEPDYWETGVIFGDRKDPKWTSQQLAQGTFDAFFRPQNKQYPFQFHAY